MSKMSVIISTYNSPEWLKNVLWGYEQQTAKDFELIVADDGSTEETAELLKKLEPKLSYKLKHVWHENKGFRKTIILNKAIKESETDYLLFSDGDCVPRNDFVASHIKNREKGYFLSGGYLKLPMSTSKTITLEDIENQNCFKLSWLLKNGYKFNRKFIRFLATPLKIDSFLNSITTTKASWNGHGSSGWKSDIVSVNGFDERMEYGGEDREMGDRLWNNQIKSKQIRYEAIVVHLDHARGYIREEARAVNRRIQIKTRVEKLTWTNFGLKQG